MPVRVFKVENMRHEVLRRFNLCGSTSDLKDFNGSNSRTYRIRGKAKAIQSPNIIFENGDLVWFDPGVAGNDYVLPGEVVEFHRAGQVVTVQAVINGKAQTFTLSNLSSVRRRQDLGQNGVEDMIQLIDLNEASLLWNLKIRYDKEFIYTYVGSILVAVNPYKMFDIYGLDIVKKYEGQILGTLPPHLFAIGSSAYARISKDGENQVVIISGESGAGKTESTKLIMQYLAAVNKSSSNLITEQILEASPLLESFGNAKTVRNDNSSRFGKYLDVHFKDGVITGAKTTEYLLEKSRIVTHSQDERNYHVFYEMLSGLSKDDKEKYGLQSADKYFYLNQGGSCEIQCKYDGEDFQALLSAMQVLGFTSDEQETIWRILSSILHLGNVYFHKKHLKYGQEGVEIGSDTEIRWAAHLLQLNVEGIVLALTTKTTEARNERVFTALNIDQALDARDAVAKALYARLFSWLVQRVNNIVFKGTKKTSIAILDIFGFEDFKENSFEQLCINYANEMLQLHFNKHIFKLEQQEYAKEKIDWQTITFQDNQPVINLISKKPIGILHVLDDESNFPKATDHSFLEKCHYNHALNDLYSRPRMSSMEFGIKHYAGQVWYSVDGFLDKNRDTLRWDVVELLISSKLPMISEMFMELRSGAEAAKTMNKANGRFVTMKPRTPTVAARFNDSLSQLVETMSECNPWFVRCLKPNNEKTPMKFDMPVVLEQLRYSGMMETIRIRKTGYPVRLKFAQFADRYRCLVPGKIPKGAPAREICRVILDHLNASRDNYQLGSTKVFLREVLEQQLERQRVEIVRRAVTIIQKYVRGRIAKKNYLAMRKSTIVLQAHVRGWLARKEYQKTRNAAIKMQANYRMAKQRKEYLQLQENMKARHDAEKLARERARAKAQRDEQERISHAVAGVNHLEIPAELAFIFSKLDDWQPPHSDRNIIKVVGNIPEIQEQIHLPKDIDQHVFTKFTNIYFKNHIWGMKRDAIKTPFLAKNKDIDYQESLSIFKLILRFMNDNNLTGKKETVLGDYIVQKALMNEKMRNEILCQLCNQTWKNDNEANTERGWVLIANCLSCFAPDKTLFKYLLKYVSDHAYDGYKAVCQKKLLQSENIEPQLSRTYPPCLLEWKSNIKRTNMALEVLYHDGESIYGPVESWSTGEEFAAQLLRRRGIAESRGWSISLNEMHTMYELNGTDYVLDLVSELEIPPAFPVCSSFFLTSTDPRHRQAMGVKKTSSPHNPDIFRTVDVEIDEFSGPTSAPARPQHMGRISRERILENQTRDKQRARSLSRERMEEENDRYYKSSQGKPPTAMERYGLSKSKLNDRYHSMENLADNTNDRRGPQVKSWNDVGLATSALNDRYFHKDNGATDVSLATSALNDRYFKKTPKRGNKDSSSSNSPSPMHGRVSEIKKNLRNEFKDTSPVNGHSNSDQIESSSSPEMPHRNGVDSPDYDFDPDPRNNRGPNANGPGMPNRYVKSQAAIKGSQTPTHSHTARVHIETQGGDRGTSKSSAPSDTSEAPSMASQFQRIPVPSQTGSDLDKYLDDLFNPVLEGNLDELSDARSLAASIKGGRHNECQTIEQYLESLYDDSDVNLATLSQMVNLSRKLKGGGDSVRKGVLSEGNSANNVDTYINDLFNPIFVDHNVDNLGNTSNLAQTLKGGGQGGVDTQPNPLLQPNSSFTFPMGGMMSPPPPSTMSGMLSPPPAMINPAMALGTNPMLGGVPVMQTVPTVPGMNSTLPLYTLGGFNMPMLNPAAAMMDPSQIALQQQMLQQHALQLNAVSSQMQQMQQRAFLASAVQQNLQLQQHLAQQNQALQQIIQQQQQQPSPVNVGAAAARTSTPVSMQSRAPEPPSNRSNAEMRANNSPAGRFRKHRHHEHDLDLRSQKVNFQDPDRSWSDSSSPQSGGPQKHFSERIPPFQDRSPSQYPANNSAWFHSPPPMKISNNAYGEVMNELKTKRNSVESIGGTPQGTRGRPPPPPPPLPPSPPEATHPFVDVFGRAKTVRIGKWRWPPAKSDDDKPDGGNLRPQPGRLVDEDDLYRPAKSPIVPKELGRSQLTSESSGSIDFVDKSPSPNDAKDGYDLKEPRRSDGSVGKLKISSDMRAKLEAVTLNHSVRSTTTHKNDARDVYKEVTKLKNQAKDDDEYHGVRKLEENRKVALQMKLTNRGMDQREPNSVRNAQSFTANPPPPPPPVGPLGFNIPPPPPPSSTYEDGSSYYGQTGSMVPEPKSPPRPISPSGNHMREMTKLRSERLERIEIIEKSDFLKPVDVAPLITDDTDSKQLESIRTKIYPMTTAPYCTYARVPWTLRIRKEVFSPAEQMSNPLVLHLIFCQVVSDTYSKACVRINTENKQKMRHMLDNYGITPNNLHSPHHKVTIKKNVVDIAREWQTYFCRLFPVNGGQQYPDAHYLGISHSGVLLVQREREPVDNLRVLHVFSLDEIIDAIVPHGSTLQVIMRNGGRITLFTHKANQIRLMLDQYCIEAETGGHEYVRAVADYITRESTLLSFRRGEIIRLIHKNQYLEKGWLYGEVGGRTGIFPCEYVVPLSRNELSEMTKQDGRYDRLTASTAHSNKHLAAAPPSSAPSAAVTHETRMQSSVTTNTTTTTTRIINSENRETHGSREALNTSAHWTESRVDYPDDKSDISQMTTSVNDGRHSLLQFALAHFRQSLDNYEMLRTADGSIRGSLKMIESMKAKKKGKKNKDSDWTWKEQVEMVKYTKSPIQVSLLKLETPDLNKLALECFIGIMRFMGDYPMATDQSDVDCVYTVLINCHKHPPLRDEVYCQIMKQTTNNKSTKADSCQRGWRLFSIIAAYFQSSELLKPYLFKYLETAAYDKRRAYHGTAMVCLQNLRKTFKYGGRKNVPSIEEIAAISAGRNSKRQIYRLPGGTERVINTKSTSVVQDIIEEICSILNVRNPHEMEEFSLYCIVEGDTFTMPLAREEYILDVTTELQRNQQVFYLIFCRSVWYYPLRLDNQLYIEVVFNQIAPDYLEGLLLVMPGGQLKQEAVYDLARVASLLHRAAQMETMPTLKETKYLLPKPILTVRDIKPPQWVNMVQSAWKDIERMNATDAKAQVLETLQKWPLFGSSFFAVKKLSDKEKRDYILALNRNGVHFLDVITHETLQRYPFSEVISTRKVRAEEGTLYLDMKCGNLMVQKITRIQTDQAHEISRLIRQYITIEQRNQGLVQGEQQNDIILPR